MGLIYSVSVLFFTFMIFRMYLKKDIRPYKWLLYSQF